MGLAPNGEGAEHARGRRSRGPRRTCRPAPSAAASRPSRRPRASTALPFTNRPSMSPRRCPSRARCARRRDERLHDRRVVDLVHVVLVLQHLLEALRLGRRRALGTSAAGLSRATAMAMPAMAIGDRDADQQRSRCRQALRARRRAIARASPRRPPARASARARRPGPMRRASAGRLSQPPTRAEDAEHDQRPRHDPRRLVQVRALRLAGPVGAVEGVEHHPRHVDRREQRRGEAERVRRRRAPRCPECPASAPRRASLPLRAREHGAEDLVLREEAGERRNARRWPASRSTSARR